jgi:transposase
VVHRRLLHPRQPRRGRRREKKVDGEPADHALGRSRGGFGTKIHLVTDGHGLPLAVEVTAGQRHESKGFEPVLNAVRVPRRRGRPRKRPKRLAGDKGYSYPWIRQWLRRHGIRAIIPQRKDQRAKHRGRPLSFDQETYKRRNVVERCVNWLKECRAVATRFDKLAVNYLSTVKLAILQRYLRLLTSADSSDRP